ncbi:hypothetical protein SDC9_161360 [bioreactor metagenome]|uniref:Uncharacterized protein n=1 Tax=bioreactor metagenome TaxID=1076179 RepID=A0A645FP73_9ZZZZ
MHFGKRQIVYRATCLRERLLPCAARAFELHHVTALHRQVVIDLRTRLESHGAREIGHGLLAGQHQRGGAV